MTDKIYADIVRGNRDIHLEVIDSLGIKAHYALKNFRQASEEFLTAVLKENGGCIEIRQMSLSHLGDVNKIYLEDGEKVCIDGNLYVVGCCYLEDIADPTELTKIVEEVSSQIKENKSKC